MTLLPLTLVLALSGCDQLKGVLGTDPAPPPTAEAPKPAAPAPAKVASSPFAAGKFADALPDLEKAVAATPTDDAAWDLVEIAAVRGGQGAALLDRLSADTAIGGGSIATRRSVPSLPSRQGARPTPSRLRVRSRP